MAKISETTALFYSILNLCKGAKMNYLHAADRCTDSQYTRFLNFQLTVRNRMYNDLVTISSFKGVNQEDLSLDSLDLGRVMNFNLNTNYFEKCVISDEALIGKLKELISIEDNEEYIEKYKFKLKQIEASLELNKEFYSEERVKSSI